MPILFKTNSAVIGLSFKQEHSIIGILLNIIVPEKLLFEVSFEVM